jgi:hypothetical protein
VVFHQRQERNHPLQQGHFQGSIKYSFHTSIFVILLHHKDMDKERFKCLAVGQLILLPLLCLFVVAITPFVFAVVKCKNYLLMF